MPLPHVMSNCFDVIGNRLEELSCHCRQLQAQNEALQQENSSMKSYLQTCGKNGLVPTSLPATFSPTGNGCSVPTPKVEGLPWAPPNPSHALKPPAPPDEQPVVLMTTESSSPPSLPGNLPRSPARGEQHQVTSQEPAKSTARSESSMSPNTSDKPKTVLARSKSILTDSLVAQRLQNITDIQAEMLTADAGFEETMKYLAVEDSDTPGIQRLVNSLAFKSLSMAAIAANTIYIGIRTDQQLKNSYLRVQGQEGEELSILPDIIFLAWFSVEVLFYMAAWKLDFFTGKNWMWNWFDFLLVINTAVEVLFPDVFTNLSFLRICRVFRMIRVVRLVRTIKPLRSLRTMLFSMIGSLTCLLWAFVMIGLVMFVFSIIFGNAAASYFEAVNVDNEAEVEEALAVKMRFGSLYESNVSLFSAITGGNDWMAYGEILRSLGSSDLYFMLFLFYIGFCLVGMLNVVTGIFVDSAVCTRTEDEVVDSYREEVQKTADEVKLIFEEADVSGNGYLTLSAFVKCLQHTTWVAAYFSGNDLDVTDARTIFTLMDRDCNGQVSEQEFVQGTLRLKGKARCVDTFAVMYDLARMAVQQEKLCAFVEDSLLEVKEFLRPGSQQKATRLFKTVDEILEEIHPAQDDSPRLAGLKRRFSRVP